MPQLDASGTGLSADSSNTTPAVGFPSVVDIHVQSSDLSSVPYSGLSRSLVESNEAPIAISTLRPSALDKIQDFLLRGERRQAYHYALDERLWPHAMIIASSINKEAWKEVVNEFLKSELGVKDEATRGPSHLRGAEASFPVVNGREGVRVAYSLFSGQGAAAGLFSSFIPCRNYLISKQSRSWCPKTCYPEQQVVSNSCRLYPM